MLSLIMIVDFINKLILLFLLFGHFLIGAYLIECITSNMVAVFHVLSFETLKSNIHPQIMNINVFSWGNLRKFLKVCTFTVKICKNVQNYVFLMKFFTSEKNMLIYIY